MHTPWHLWVVGSVALLWYALGAITIQLAQLGQLPGVDAQEAAYYAAKPAWLVLGTAIATYGSVLASILLLLRNRLAFAAYAIALAAILMCDVVEMADGSSRAYASQAAAIATTVIAAIAVWLAWYSGKMLKRGVLR